jgi:hypothetical protein
MEFVGRVTTPFCPDCRSQRSIPQAAFSLSLVSSVSAFRKLRDEAKRTPTRARSVSVVTALPSQDPV